MTATSIGVSNSTVLMKPCAIAPITAAGAKASRTAPMNRRATGSWGASRTTCTSRAA